MEKTSTTNLPISKKSHQQFTERVVQVFGNQPGGRKAVKALNEYLAGNTVYYLDHLPREWHMAFRILIKEIEAAMDRSAKARERAAKRAAAEKENSQPSVTAETGAETAVSDESLLVPEENKVNEENVSKSNADKPLHPHYVSSRHSKSPNFTRVKLRRNTSAFKRKN